jgi:hypothetical protein
MNQHRASQKNKEQCMKNMFKVFGIIFMVMIIGFVMMGCSGLPTAPRSPASAPVPHATTTTSTVTHENNGVFGQDIIIPAKDFESVGLVFTENRYVTKDGTVEGDVFTYQALLKEANKLGADTIINLVIDKKIEYITIDESSYIQETWYGTALAIKYTEIIKTGEGEDVYLNGFTKNESGGVSATATEITPPVNDDGGFLGIF